MGSRLYRRATKQVLRYAANAAKNYAWKAAQAYAFNKIRNRSSGFASGSQNPFLDITPKRSAGSTGGGPIKRQLVGFVPETPMSTSSVGTQSVANLAGLARARRAKYMPGKSAGFVKTRRTKRKRAEIAGINYTGEFGGTASNVDMIIIGHCTHPSEVVYRQVWSATLKKLFKAADYDVLDMDKEIPVNGQCVITYKRNPQDTIQIDVIVVGPDGAVSTLNDLVAYYVNTARAWNANVSSSTATLEWFAIQYVPLTPAEDEVITMQEARIRLDQLAVSVHSKSSFKMQNRTVNTEGEDETAVDNVPLYGKSYQGTGAGAYWINNESYAESFIADRTNGLIKTTRPGIMHEPPKPSEFKGNQKLGKIRVEPGSIKTSVLTADASHMFTTWFRSLVPNLSIATPQTVVGKYRFFCIEKILDPDHVANILCAFEHNLAITSHCKTIVKNPTCMVFEQAHGL